MLSRLPRRYYGFCYVVASEEAVAGQSAVVSRQPCEPIDAGSATDATAAIDKTETLGFFDGSADVMSADAKVF